MEAQGERLIKLHIGDSYAPPPYDLPVDESKMMAALAALESEAGGLDEDDPRQAARFMRRFADATGLPVGGAMEEAMRRMEAGEDPDEIEADLGDRLDEEDPFESPAGALKQLRRLTREPDRDPEIYDL